MSDTTDACEDCTHFENQIQDLEDELQTARTRITELEEAAQDKQTHIKDAIREFTDAMRTLSEAAQ